MTKIKRNLYLKHTELPLKKRKHEKHLPYLIIFVSIATILSSIVAYRFRFKGNLSSDSNDWGNFGSYIGAITTAVVVLINLYLIYYQFRKDANAEQMRMYQTYVSRNYSHLSKLYNCAFQLQFMFSDENIKSRHAHRIMHPNCVSDNFILAEDVKLCKNMETLLLEDVHYIDDLHWLIKALDGCIHDYLSARKEIQKTKFWEELDNTIHFYANRLKVTLEELLKH